MRRTIQILTAEEVYQLLDSAGWEPEEGEGGTIWRNPSDGCWYDELRALAILREGIDPGAQAD